MSGIISFLVFCVVLAICLVIGFFILNFALSLLFMGGVGIFAALAWVWRKLTGRDL